MSSTRAEPPLKGQWLPVLESCPDSKKGQLRCHGSVIVGCVCCHSHIPWPIWRDATFSSDPGCQVGQRPAFFAQQHGVKLELEACRQTDVHRMTLGQ